MNEKFLGTGPVRDRHRFDVSALEIYMRSHLDGFEGPMEVEQFRGGQSNPTFLLRSPARAYVLRCKPPGKLLPSAHAIDREFRVMAALEKTSVPVARTYALCEDDGVIGAAFYIMEFVEGRIFWETSLPGMAASERVAHFDAMNRAIADLHSVDPVAVGLSEFGRSGNFFARQIARWTAQYRASEIIHVEAMERLINWLPAHIPADNRTAIVHGDFRLDNLIFHPVAPHVVAILDWELSTLGHPMADFAYHCASWYLPPGRLRGLAGLDLVDLGIPPVEDYVNLYCTRTGQPPVPKNEWEFYLAYNLFRGAAITQGIMKRALDGNASSEHALEMGGRTRELADLAWSRIDRLVGG
jgi:aminoglycoside phosphotransferase (APT) family kinase protein